MVTKTHSKVSKTDKSAMRELLLKLDFNSGYIQPSNRQTIMVLKQIGSGFGSEEQLTASLPALKPD